MGGVEMTNLDKELAAGVCPSCNIPAAWTVDGRPRCLNCGHAEDVPSRSIERSFLWQPGSCVVVSTGLDNHGKALRPFGQLEISMESDGPRGPCSSAMVSADMSAQDIRRLADLLISHAARLDWLHEQMASVDLAS